MGQFLDWDTLQYQLMNNITWLLKTATSLPLKKQNNVCLNVGYAKCMQGTRLMCIFELEERLCRKDGKTVR